MQIPNKLHLQFKVVIHEGSNISKTVWESEKHFLFQFSRSSIVSFWKKNLLQTHYAIPLTLTLYEFRFLWDQLIRHVIEVTIRKTLGPKVLGNCYLHEI